MIWDVHPGSGSCFFTHPGSRGQKVTGSRIRIRNTGVHPPPPTPCVCYNYVQKALGIGFEHFSGVTLR
jgi:hypothetical protein